MTDYSAWSREDLIQRVQELESASSSALSESEERMRAILQTAVEGIITIDENGIIESVNPAAERLFGYSASELLGRNVSLLMPSPYREEHDRYMRNYRETGRAKIIGIGREVVGRRKDGSVFPMDLSVGEVKLAGRRLFTGIVRDITSRKRAEEQLAEKNKELETVVYVASHDLRSPLVNIQGFSKELALSCRRVKELIARRDDPEATAELQRILNDEVPEAIEYILAGVNKIDTLLAGFLRFSRLGRAALHIERISMDRLVGEVLRTMEFQIKEAGAVVTVKPLDACLGDAVQLTQVFSNLVDNAIKYRDPARPLRIEISSRQEGSYAVYEVADNGLGIAAEHQAKIFEIFHRLNPTATEGEGLGLTIAQRSLERQNGKISVESTAGQGSTFFVWLPRSTR